MLAPTTLLIKHLPSELQVGDREEFLTLVGAFKVRVMPDDGRMRHTAFATFPSHEAAKNALLLLHQREVLGRRLVVEFSKDQHQDMLPRLGDHPKLQAPTTKEGIAKPSEKEVIKLDAEDFSRKLHGVAPVLGLEYLPSPLLKYTYPSPTPSTIQNISHALASVPKFYTQVLHLMNKMNLPAPFGPLTPAPPLSPEQPMKQEACEMNMEAASSAEESEYESETEEGEMRIAEKVLPQKRVLKKPRVKVKKPKLSDFAPAEHSTITRQRTEPSEVFESQTISLKKISMKNINQMIPVAPSTSVETVGVFGAIQPVKVSEESELRKQEFDEDISIGSKWISFDELHRKRLSSREMKTMSIFRTYSPGEPTCRLYIKNLARQVEEKDLSYIFLRYINPDSESDRNMFDIKLMKEGRMKGQAFVTLANEEQAIEAVRETNGFVLHTKPLVVQFARSAKPKEDDKKGKKT